MACHLYRRRYWKIIRIQAHLLTKSLLNWEQLILQQSHPCSATQLSLCRGKNWIQNDIFQILKAFSMLVLNLTHSNYCFSSIIYIVIHLKRIVHPKLLFHPLQTPNGGVKNHVLHTLDNVAPVIYVNLWFTSLIFFPY